MQRKSRRVPVGYGRVAHRTIVRQVQRQVVRVLALVKIRRVAACTGIWRGRVVAVHVTQRTLVCHRHMRPRERVHRRMVEGRRHPGRLRVAGRAVVGELVCHVVGVGRPLEIGGMAADAGIRRVVVVAVVTGGAVVRNIRMCPV